MKPKTSSFALPAEIARRPPLNLHKGFWRWQQMLELRKQELSVWKTAPDELSIQRLLASRGYLYTHRHRTNQHILTRADHCDESTHRWAKQIIGLYHNTLMAEEARIHQATALLAVMNRYDISDEVRASADYQSPVLRFVARMQDVLESAGQ